MNYPFPRDVQQLVEAHLTSGHYTNEDDVLRDALRALQEENEDLAAVKEAISEWRAGDEGIPLEDAFKRVRDGDIAEEAQ